MGFQFQDHKRWSLSSETLNQSLPNLTRKIYEQLSNLIKAHSYENKYLHISVQTHQWDFSIEDTLSILLRNPILKKRYRVYKIYSKEDT